MESVEVMKALNPKTKKKTDKYLPKIDCKYCGLVCMFIIILLVQFVFHPSPVVIDDGSCYDKREILLNSNGTSKITMCKNYLESRRYHSMTLKLQENIFSFDQIESQTLRYFLLWCPQQYKTVCTDYNYNMANCYKAMKYKEIVTCFGDRMELLYATVGDVILSDKLVRKIEEIVIYWF